MSNNVNPHSKGPVSLCEAINNAKPILKNKSSSWLGKKIYLGYSEQKGWQIHELNLWDRLIRLLGLGYQDTAFEHVVKHLKNLTSQDAEAIPESDLIHKVPQQLSPVLQAVCAEKITDVGAQVSGKPVPAPTAKRVVSPPGPGAPHSAPIATGKTTQTENQIPVSPTKETVAPTPTPTPAPSPTPVSTPTSAPSPTPTSSTPISTPSPTSAPSPTPTSSPTPVSTPTSTPSPTSALLPTPTSSPTSVSTPTSTPSPTSAPLPTPTSSPTSVSTPTSTPSPTSAPLPTPTSSPTSVSTPTSTPSPTPASAPTPTSTSSTSAGVSTPGAVSGVTSGVAIPRATRPLGLKQMGNSCHLDSVMEMVLSQTHIREQLWPAKRRIQEKKEDIRRELAKEIDDEARAPHKGAEVNMKEIVNRLRAQRVEVNLNRMTRQQIKDLQAQYKGVKVTDEEINNRIRENYERALREISSKEAIIDELIRLMQVSSRGESRMEARELRRLLFNSRLNDDFTPDQMTAQQDALVDLQIVLSDLLDHGFEIRGEDRTPIFQLPMPTGVAKRATLDDAIAAYSPTLGILSMPDIMAIQLKRFHFNPGTGALTKINDPIDLPPNGIVDFSRYYAGEAPDSCQYEITGYVVHRGGGSIKDGGGGHYVSYTKIGDQYFYCNDHEAPRAISREEFLKNGREANQSYLLMLKKISPVAL